MKRSLTALSALIFIAGAAHAAPLTVDLTGVEARGGKIYISIQTEDQFMKEEGFGKIIETVTTDLSETFDLPEGRYAVSVWHDDNGNGTFDRAANGMPEDGWAMHNGKALRGLPSFADVSIDVSSAGATVSESMIYGR